MLKTNNTIIKNKDGVEYFQFPPFVDFKFLKHAMSTRLGGVSKSYFSSMNLGLGNADDIKNVNKNWEIFCNATDIPLSDVVCADQKHNDNILFATTKHCGQGVSKQRVFNDIDAIITTEKNVAISVFTADCVPVLFVDSKKQIIGAAHCGWKGTYKELAKKMVNTFIDKFKSNPNDIFIVIAPSIHKCCYEVSKELYLDFKNKFPYLDNLSLLQKNESFYLDLPNINKQILLNCGIKENNIFVSDICSCCNPEILFSHRQSKGKRGLMAVLMEMK